MCAPWDAGCLADEVATAVSGTVFGQISEMITTAELWLIDAQATQWVTVPSIGLYPHPVNTDPDAAPLNAVIQLRALILPITAFVAMGGMLWNGLLMVLSRKPAPLVTVLRGLWNTALWSAIGVFGTNLLIAGTDELSMEVVMLALHSVGDPSLAKRLSTLLVPATKTPGGLPIGLVILISAVGMACSTIQTLLMVFRDGSVIILAATTPLAASGTFTNATKGWLPKVMAWQLALIFYKPCAAMVYAAMIWLTGENSTQDPRVMLMGLAMMIVALVALPVLLRFFTWTVGGLQSGSGGLGMLATAGAAGMHAASSMRGVGGGTGVTEHARYINDVFNRSPGGETPPRGSAGDPGPRSGGPGGPPVRPPTFAGPAASAGRAGAASGGAAAGAAGGATGVAMGASAAAGPAAPVVAGVVAVANIAVQTGTAVVNAAADASADSSKDG